MTMMGAGGVCGAASLVSAMSGGPRCRGGAASAACSFHLLETGADSRRNRAAGQFDGHHRTEPLDEREHGHAQESEIMVFGFVLLSHGRGKRTENAVTEQDPEKRAHEGGRDAVADLLLR